MVPHNLAILPPHQRTPHQLLRIRFFPGNLLPRLKIHGWLTRDFPLPRRKVLVPVHRQRLDVEVVEVGEGLCVRLFYFLVAHLRGFGACAGVLVGRKKESTKERERERGEKMT